MKRFVIAALSVGAALAAQPLHGQAVPEGSPAARVHAGYRRWPSVGIDPFRHTFQPRWGLTLQTGLMGANNALNAADLGAIIFLSDSVNNPDGLLLGDIVDAFGLVPEGQGVRGVAALEAGAALGGPLGGRLSLGLTAMGRVYGNFFVDDGAVRLFREGNFTNQEFLLGETQGSGLATADGGAHLLINAGPVGSPDGARLTVGLGARIVRPLVYSRGEMATDSRIALTDTSVAANVVVDVWRMSENAAGDFELAKGSGMAADLLARLAWPTSGFALEAMIANLGSVTIDNLVHERFEFRVNSTSLKEVSDSLDAADFDSLGVESRDVSLPRVVRMGASGWANRILQLDVAATLPISGEFEQPLIVELGSTWRLFNAMPLRAGLVLGGTQGIGYTAGWAIETKNLLFRLTGGSLGGLFRNAKGAAGRLEFGFYF